jgi:hypothetical protein
MASPGAIQISLDYETGSYTIGAVKSGYKKKKTLRKTAGKRLLS